jgi:hypothetical protein
MNIPFYFRWPVQMDFYVIIIIAFQLHSFVMVLMTAEITVMNHTAVSSVKFSSHHLSMLFNLYSMVRDFSF